MGVNEEGGERVLEAGFEGSDGESSSPSREASRKAEETEDEAKARRQSITRFAAARASLRRFVQQQILRRTTLPPSRDGRHIPLALADVSSRPIRLMDERRGHNRGYISNAIRTSRYTVIDFVPKQLFFQFTRLGNFYFLCIGIPQTISGLSTTGNYTTILPLLFFVLLTVVKEGYDDYKRHRLDTIENAQLATVLRPIDEVPSVLGEQWWQSLWASVAAWMLALLSLLSPRTARWLKRKRTPSMPTKPRRKPDSETFAGLHWTDVQWRHVRVGDVVRLTRDEDVPADMLLLHANGESGLAYVETMALDGETNLKSKQVPAPLAEGRCASLAGLVDCTARFVVEDPNPDLYHFDGRVTVDGEKLPLTLAEVVYRGSTLRNTPCAIGLVVNTGEECKIRMNANRHPRAKKPALEHVTNGIVLILAAYVVLLTTGCSLAYYFWHRGAERRSWYLNNAGVQAVQIVFGFAIQFNNVIPLALYVSLEIVKIGQMLMLNCDIAMYDEASDTPARCNTNTILENLGQIGYVFSDKTGTLTENVMKFRKLSVAGTSWLHEADLQQQGAVEANEAKEDPVAQVQAPYRLSTSSRTFSPPRADPDSSSMLSPTAPQDGRRSSSVWRSTGRPDHVQPELTTDDLLEYIRLRPFSPFSRQVITYMLAMALCHTCIPEMEDGQLIGFQASSPDELALVTAAEEMGFLVVHKSANSTTVRFSYTHAEHPVEEVYEVVDVIEFSSLRKRMSVIVRRPDGRLWLICKGADSVVLPRLRMAPLAMQKVRDVRKSADIEREIIRKSEQYEPRNSFGGPASVVIRKSIGGAHRNNDRSQSFDLQRLPRQSVDTLRVPGMSAAARAPSFDIASISAQRPSPLSTRPLRMMISGQQRPPLPEKFAFLEDPSLAEDEGSIFEQCFKHMDDFAAEGLRTLLFAHKFIPEAEYQTWKKEFLAASTSLTDRQERIEATAEAIEQNLNLIGASAIEDKLQKGVPDTVDKLRRANIKIWMLTGDKRETAINIAHSARICRPTSDIYILDASRGDLAGQLLHIAESLGIHNVGDVSDATGTSARSHRLFWPSLSSKARPSSGRPRHHTVVVIDGHTLGVIQKQQQQQQPESRRSSKQRAVAPSMSLFSVDPNLQDLFYSIIPAVDSVICCRASPAQKALLVRSIRNGNGVGRSPGLTLAIGDGANDLAMLAEAHVGIGVSGREGLQAARVADYSIAQFRFLARLLLVHGRWNYARTARFILSTFWKEMFFYTPAAAFQYYVGFTGTSIYESWSLTALNTLFTSLCVIVPAIVEQDLGQSVLMAVPELYAFGQRGQGLNPTKYVAWMLAAVAEGLLVWFGCWAGFGAFMNSRDNGIFALGDLVFGVCIIWTNVRLLILKTHAKSMPILLSFFITMLGWWVWNCILASIYGKSPSPYAARGGFFHTFGRELSWWVTTLLVVAGLSVMELCYLIVKRNMTIRDIWKGRKNSGAKQQGHKTRTWLPWKFLWPSFLCGQGSASTGKNNGNEDDYDEGDDDVMEMPADELDLGLWQDMERDPEVKARLRLINGEEDDDELWSWGVDWCKIGSLRRRKPETSETEEA